MPRLSKITFGACILIALFTGVASAQLGNNNPTGTAGQFNGNVTTGCSYDPYTGNATRSVTDLVVVGGVGTYPLAFTRTMNSRYFAGNATPFGAGGNWTHSYAWTIDGVSNIPSGNFPASYTVHYPDGRAIIFNPPSGSDPDYRSPLGVPDRLEPVQNDGGAKTECYVRLPDGGRVHFHATVSAPNTNNQVTYTFKVVSIIDPYTQTTTITDATDGMSTTVKEPAGRTIQIFYKTITNANTVEGKVGDKVISYITASDGRTVNYNYKPYPSANQPLYTTLSSVAYFAALDPSPTTALYTYQSDNINPTGRPLLQTCSDPMYDGPMWKVAYNFVPTTSALVSGQISSEAHPNGTIVSTLTVTSSSSGITRTETRGDKPGAASANPSRSFTYGDNGYELTSKTDFKPGNNSIDQTHDSKGFIASVTDQNRNQTTYQCMKFGGNVTDIKYPIPSDVPNGTQTEISYPYISNGADSNTDPNNPYYIAEINDGNGNHMQVIYRDTTHRVGGIYYYVTGGHTYELYEGFSYNSFGQLQYHELMNTSVESYEFSYPDKSQVSAYRDAAHSDTSNNPTAWYQYDSFGRISTITDGRGQFAGDQDYTTSFQYNPRGQLTKLVHPDRTYVQYGYNPEGTLAWTADERHPTANTDPTYRTTYTYDDYKRLRTVTTTARGSGDQTSRTTTYYYDSAGNGAEDYTHTAAVPTKVVSPGSKVTTTIYDENLRATSVTAQGDSNVPSATTTYQYDAVGNTTQVKDPNGQSTGLVTNYTYDEMNRVRYVDDPVNAAVGHTMKYTYDTGGNVTKKTRIDGNYATFSYDGLGRVTQSTDYSGNPTTYTYDGSNYTQAPNLVSITNGGGHEYDYTYDAISRKTSATYPSDYAGVRRTESYVYDIANHLVQYTNPAGQNKTLAYDGRGRLTDTMWDSNGPTVHIDYDATRPTKITTTTNGMSIGFGYDEANNRIYEDQTVGVLPTGLVQPLKAVSRLTHGAGSSAQAFDLILPLGGYPGVECRNGGGNYQMVIDFARPVTVGGVSLSGTGTPSTPSVSGNEVTVNLTGVTDAQIITVTLLNVNDGKNTANVSIPMGVLLGDVNGDGFVNSADIGLVKALSGHALTTSTFRADVNLDGFINSADIGLVKSQSGVAGLSSVPVVTHRVQTDPDADGNRTDLLVTTATASGTTTNFAASFDYTSRNELLNIYNGTGSTHSAMFTYSYDASGNVAGRTAHGIPIATSLTYDALNRPIFATHSNGGTTFSRNQYEYTSVGNVQDILRGSYPPYEDGKGDYFTGTNYDPINQLQSAVYSGTTATDPNPARSVSYSTGNRNWVSTTINDNTTSPRIINQSTTYGHDNLNQYTDININGSDQTIQYDNNFNLTWYNSWTYSYDAENRLISATLPQNGQIPGHTATFMYDGIGRCIQRTIDGATTVYTYDQWTPIVEWDGNGNVTATNVYGLGDDEVLRRIDYTTSPTQTLYYLPDQMGNVRFLLDASGAVVAKYNYDAYGQPYLIVDPRTGNHLDPTTDPTIKGNRFMYGGREYFSRLGLYDMRNRVYDPQMGRFYQTDPIGFEGDASNLYRFSGNNPLLGGDPSGLQTDDQGSSDIGSSSSSDSSPDSFLTGTFSTSIGGGADLSGGSSDTLGLGGGSFGSEPFGGTYSWTYTATSGNQTTASSSEPWKNPDGSLRVGTYVWMGLKGVPAYLQQNGWNSLKRNLSDPKFIMENAPGGFGIAAGIERGFLAASETSVASMARIPLALGLKNQLEEFAEARGAVTYKQLGDTTNWKPRVFEKLADPNTQVHFNLDGVDVWGGVQRGASGFGGGTDWELFQIQQNPRFWNSLQFWKGSKPVNNPFQ